MEIPEGDEKNSVFLHHFDLQSCSTISTVEYVKLNPSSLLSPAGNRYAKTIALSTTEKYLFAAGIAKVGTGEIGFLAAHSVKDGFKEITVVSTNEGTHKVKKGFYRVSKLDHTDILIAAGWLDLCLYYFTGLAFEKIVFLPSCHESKRA